VLTKVEESAVGTTFSLKSVSGKLITAIAASSPPSQATYHHYYDYLDRGALGLATGVTYQLRISPQETASNVQHVLQIDAVIFDDGSAEGSRGDIDFMNAKRLGRALETERIRGLLARPETQSRGVEGFAAGVGILPEHIAEALVELKDVSLPGLSVLDFESRGRVDPERAFVSGVRNARQEAQWKVKEIQQLPVGPSADVGERTQAAAISALRQRYEELVTSYRERGQKTLGRLPK
jgi:hypothetical protein